MNAPHPAPPARGREAAELKVLIAAPRGFWAGVDRAIRTDELGLPKYGAPVHVRTEIVQNPSDVDSLSETGAIFVDAHDHGRDERGRRASRERMSLYMAILVVWITFKKKQ